MNVSIKKHIPASVRRALRYNILLKAPWQKRRYNSIVRRISAAGHCNVLMIASSLPMWRYQEVCRLLMADSRFSLKVAIIPFGCYEEKDRRNDVRLLEDHFRNSGIPHEVVSDFKKLKREFKPDLIFYPQPYVKSYADSNAEWGNNRDCLLAHVPYSLPLTTLQWYVNLEFHNLAWRYYVASDIHRDLNRTMADNRGENIVIVGEPHADSLLQPPASDPWKPMADGIRRKRVIWAPHFSVTSYNLFDRPDFNWSYKVMLEIAREYADRLQIVFKPHPRLRSELYKHPDWGKEKTDEFYRTWETMPNTSLATGDYIDLFKTSDAMIHNCGSFTAEYLWLRKPVGYIARDSARIKAELNEFGAACQDAHYPLGSPEEIRRFIDMVVIGDNDPMAPIREETFEKMLRNPNGVTVAENIYNDIVKSLGL